MKWEGLRTQARRETREEKRLSDEVHLKNVERDKTERGNKALLSKKGAV